MKGMRWGAAVVGGLVAVTAVFTTCSGGKSSPSVILGSTSTTATTALAGPVLVPDPLSVDPARRVKRESGPVGGLKPADGRPYGNIAFRSTIPIPPDLVFILIIGSDARPKDDIRRTNADSVHLLAVNPRTLEGTIVGLPRDAYVDIPGRGRGKLTSALQMGGPKLVIDTVHRLSGLPIHYYVLTGFAGLANMVDQLGGVDVHVDRRMNDRYSGARFEPGWHHFSGAQALAFSRNRHDVPDGDFSRSRNQGVLILAALAKMRAEVGDDEGLRRWIGVLSRHTALDIGLEQLLRLGALARRLVPVAIDNVVTPGRVGTASGGQSVVYLSEQAANIFIDLRADAVLGEAGPEQTTTTTTTEPSTTTTSTVFTTTTTLLPTTTSSTTSSSTTSTSSSTTSTSSTTSSTTTTTTP